MPRRTRLCNRWAVEVESSPSSTRPGHGTPLRAGLAESVDAVHSKCIVERRAGSSPASGTNPEPRPHRGRGSVIFQVAAQSSAVACPRPLGRISSAFSCPPVSLGGSHLARSTATETHSRSIRPRGHTRPHRLWSWNRGVFPNSTALPRCSDHKRCSAGGRPPLPDCPSEPGPLPSPTCPSESAPSSPVRPGSACPRRHHQCESRPAPTPAPSARGASAAVPSARGASAPASSAGVSSASASSATGT
jgi:hypothetical protein